MDAGGLVHGAAEQVLAFARWLSAGTWTAVVVVALALIILLLGVWCWVARRQRRTRLPRSEWGVRDLKERLRRRLAEPAASLAASGAGGPTLGVADAFDADIEAAADIVFKEAGGRRAGAKHLLRKRLRTDATLNGSEASYWRQLGALSLLDSTQDAYIAYSRAADLAPDDPQVQMQLGVLALRSGRLDAAEAAFRRQMELEKEKLNGAAMSHRAGTMLGDVLAAKGDHDAALAAYETAERNVAARAEQEPTDPRWQRDLSLAHDRIGEMLLSVGQTDLALERFRKSLAIAEARAKAEPDHADCQRDLSVTHDRIGEAHERKGDLDQALASYLSALSAAEALARREPGRLDWQWDLSASHDRVGDVLLAKGKANEALASYRSGLQIAEGLAARDPMRTSWQRDLAVSYHKVGSLEAASGNESEARELLERGREIIARLARIAAHQAQWRSDLARFEEALRDLEP
jgi:tetratricopeptide (TPR) repeat protein